MTEYESGHIGCPQLAKVRSPIVKSLGQELLNNRHIVEQCRLGQTAFLQQIIPELTDDFGSCAQLARLLLFRDTGLTKHGQHSSQRFGIASADPLFPASNLQEPIHHVAVQIVDFQMFLPEPSAKIGDYDDLLSDRVVSVALLGHPGRIRIEIFIQRPLAEPFYRS